jgi:hypothetical protein
MLGTRCLSVNKFTIVGLGGRNLDYRVRIPRKGLAYPVSGLGLQSGKSTAYRPAAEIEMIKQLSATQYLTHRRQASAINHLTIWQLGGSADTNGNCALPIASEVRLGRSA